MNPRGVRLLTLCDCPWHPCTHNPPLRDWRFHLFGRIPVGPVAPASPFPPRVARLWRRLGTVKPVDAS